MTQEAGSPINTCPDFMARAAAVSPRDLIDRSGRHLRQIAADLQAIEATVLAALGPTASAAVGRRIQSLDLTIQQLHGLSNILASLAPTLSGAADPKLVPMVCAPRLQSLAQALLATDAAPNGPSVELF